ncbi:MAG: ISAs1 family transposase [Acidobacteriota bacterium]|nr:ISAs1 family transposase [Acidobacteriota bacterium]
MGLVESLPAANGAIPLRSITVRPTCGAQEHRLWDRLVEAHHYLGFGGLFGKGLRHVATLGPAWVALVGWQAAALKLTARDRWIGWTLEQQLQRLHLVAQNARFVILPAYQGVPNLASRVLGLSLRRLSGDMQREHGYAVLLAESFVDRARFAGSCYRAANWRSLGFTGGYARQPGAVPQWRQHGQPKEVLVYELQPDARAALGRPEEDPAWQGPELSAPPPAAELRSMFECLAEVADYRCARGQRYRLRTVLVLALAARLAGYRGVTAFAQFAALLDAQQRRAVECFYSPSRGCYTTPSITTFHNILAALPPQTLEQAVAAWARQQSGQIAADEEDTDTQAEAGRVAEDGSGQGILPGIAMDGKDVRGASKQTAQGRRMLVAAVEHGSGLVLGQVEVASKTNEIPAVRALAGQLELAGRCVTLDALHVQHETARSLLEDCRADYLVTAVKDNQPTMLDDLQHMLFQDCPCHETLDKQHGRIERRRYWVKDISAPGWDGYANLYGRQQAIRIERERQVLKSGQSSLEVSYALTSLSAAQATPKQLAGLIRDHWQIENRLHYVRDFSYDEDRCRAWVGELPRNLACLTNAAISIIRCQSGFAYVPEANRHYAARPQQALELLLNPPRG